MRKAVTILILIVLLSVGLRAYLVQEARFWPVADVKDYLVLAYNLAHGQGLHQESRKEDVWQGRELYAYRSPGFPAYLASLYSIFGWRNHRTVLWFNVLWEALTILLIFGIARHLGNIMMGLWAAAVFGLHVLWVINPMTESLFTFLFTALVFLVLDLNRRKVFPLTALSLVAYAIRPISVSLLPAIFWVRPLRKALIYGFVFLLPIVIYSTLWSYRNYKAIGHPLVSTTNFGKHNTADFGIDPMVCSHADGEWEINDCLKRKIREFIREHPGLAAGIYIHRIFNLFHPKPAWETGVIHWRRTFALEPGHPEKQKWSGIIYRTLSDPFWYALLYCLALAGAFAALWRKEVNRQIATVILSFILIHGLVSQGSIRFAAPLHPIICLSIGYLFSLRTAAKTAKANVHVSLSGHL